MTEVNWVKAAAYCYNNFFLFTPHTAFLGKLLLIVLFCYIIKKYGEQYLQILFNCFFCNSGFALTGSTPLASSSCLGKSCFI
ncbi:MAG: hypothetical protein COU42_01345 [Candidatus Nealsonbacteria bacterium CG10_big_fil_rev_8_21_14_0_10_36_24]|uniref:Uncharacterized protein n=1 Tax=Candidatus Nealsonbacteria bacterium CG10_big_fil_rev_8_21_14_0_10_36_24 TaxID=1974710 RepID=A0A2M6NSW1_9BACT|nr:MAG: hypothetical protein COU42_01345 [Candidatus Nealsonbacteria bacterium CG10_big_fil_rev_8_21_14_0_10_36_24]